MTLLPPLADLLDGAAVVALPLVTRFRGIDVREAMLLRGPNGWTEFSPFPEYDDAEAATWLAAAIDFGWGAPPRCIATASRSMRRCPRSTPDEVEGVLARFPGMRTVKVKVAERGQKLRMTWPACARRVRSWGRWAASASTPTARGTWTRRNVPPTRSRRSTSSTSSSRARRWRSSPSCAPGCTTGSFRSRPTRVCARPRIRCWSRAKERPTSWCSRRSRSAAIAAALRIAAEAGLPVVVSSALETSVGIAMGAHLAAAIPELEFDCGLATVALLEQDVAVDPLPCRTE